MPSKVKDDVGDVETNLDLVTVPEDVKQYAREKLGETPETTLQTLQELRDMIYGTYIIIILYHYKYYNSFLIYSFFEFIELKKKNYNILVSQLV